MKRELTMKFFTGLATLLLATGLFAQIPGYDNGAGGDNYDDAGTTYVTVGKTIPLYASPDSYYHPSYDPAAGTGLTAGFTWSWSATVGAGFVTLGAVSDNYTTVTGAAAGTATINVQEVAPYAAGCSDAGTNVDVVVVEEPTIEFNATSITMEDCEGGTFPAIEVTVGGGYDNYRMAWTLTIKSTAADATETWYDDENGTNPVGAAKFAVEYTQAVPQTGVVSGDNTITTVGAFNAIGGESTEYTYSINGINDQASRWGDFLTLAGLGTVNTATAGDYDYYDTAGETITITVHPTPTTGPIFHIDGGYAN